MCIRDRNEGGAPMGNAVKDSLMAYGKGVQEAYDGDLDKSKFTFEGTSRR